VSENNIELADIALMRADGSATSLKAYRGKVVMIVNVASKCGLTPQYEGLEQLYRDRRDAGLEVLAFPTGNFREQEFDTDAEIAQFCSVNYGVTFPLFSRISVAGPDQHPLYAGITQAYPEANAAGEFREMMSKHGLSLAAAPGVLWNFEKFLISRQGEVAGRFAPHIGAQDPRLLKAIDAELAGAK